jgi:hypothetical protein
MRPVKTIPGMGERGKRRMMEEVNSTMIYFKNFCKCHNVPQYNNNMIIITTTIIKDAPHWAGGSHL